MKWILGLAGRKLAALLWFFAGDSRPSRPRSCRHGEIRKNPTEPNRTNAIESNEIQPNPTQSGQRLLRRQYQGLTGPNGRKPTPGSQRRIICLIYSKPWRDKPGL
jgi:hypothetical protein